MLSLLLTNTIIIIKHAKIYPSNRYALFMPLQKHAYSNILKFLPPKNENLQMKNSDNFIFLLKT